MLLSETCPYHDLPGHLEEDDDRESASLRHIVNFEATVHPRARVVLVRCDYAIGQF
jgi:hypothetical protein